MYTGRPRNASKAIEGAYNITPESVVCCRINVAEANHRTPLDSNRASKYCNHGIIVKFQMSGDVLDPYLVNAGQFHLVEKWDE